MNALLVLPVIVPLAFAVLSLLLPGHRAQRWAAVVGTALLLAGAAALLAAVWSQGIRATQLGGWPAPFGITLVADHLSAAMVLVSALVGFAVAVYAVDSIDAERVGRYFYPFYHVLLMGVNGAFLTGDLFNLYVWFEVLLIASFALLVLGNEREQVRGAVVYVAMNLIGSALFLSAVGLLYGTTGTLNMAELSVRLPGVETPGIVTTLAVLLFVAFGLKAAVFPLFFWLPESYHTPPPAVSAIFAGLLTKVGVYALIRTFTLMFAGAAGFLTEILLVVAGLTMLTGVLGAVAQNDIRRILSFHIISQIGYMVMGLAIYTPLAVAGAIFYIVHHIIVKTNLFLVGGVMQRLCGSADLERLGGLYRNRPLLAILFAIPALSLAGLPPLSGFWAKLLLIKAGLDVRDYLIVAAALAAGLLTLLSMTKIWAQAYWKAAPTAATGTASRPAVIPMALLAVLTLAIGLAAQPLLTLATRAASELLEPTAYIVAVLGSGSVTAPAASP